MPESLNSIPSSYKILAAFQQVVLAARGGRSGPGELTQTLNPQPHTLENSPSTYGGATPADAAGGEEWAGQ